MYDFISYSHSYLNDSKHSFNIALIKNSNNYFDNLLIRAIINPKLSLL